MGEFNKWRGAADQNIPYHRFSKPGNLHAGPPSKIGRIISPELCHLSMWTAVWMWKQATMCTVLKRKIIKNSLKAFIKKLKPEFRGAISVPLQFWL